MVDRVSYQILMQGAYLAEPGLPVAGIAIQMLQKVCRCIRPRVRRRA
jgi:hypothetical protein